MTPSPPLQRLAAFPAVWPTRGRPATSPDCATHACGSSLRGVTRTYTTGAGRDLTVLKGVDLDVHAGEIVGLIGPSGSGKSSLLHAAGLLEHPTAGQVAVTGVDCTRLNDRARSRLRLGSIGFVYQFHHLLAEFTALDNIALPQMINGASRARRADAGAANC